MKERRTTQQIYYDVLSTIMKEGNGELGPLKRTSLQLGTKVSYDKIILHLSNLIKFKLINPNYTITERGFLFHQMFTEIISKVTKLQDKFKIPLSVPPAPNCSPIVTLDALQHIQELSDALSLQVKLSKQYVKMQREMK